MSWKICVRVQARVVCAVRDQPGIKVETRHVARIAANYPDGALAREAEKAAAKTDDAEIEIFRHHGDGDGCWRIEKLEVGGKTLGGEVAFLDGNVYRSHCEIGRAHV